MTHPLPDLARLREAASKYAAMQDALDRLEFTPGSGDFQTVRNDFREAWEPRVCLALLDAYEKMAAALEPFARMGDLIMQYELSTAQPLSVTEYGEYFIAARDALNR